MPRHEFWPAAYGWISPACMAINAYLKIKLCLNPLEMAVPADKRLTLVVLDMPVQAEAGIQIVLKWLPIQKGWRPAMLVMAFPATGWENSQVNLRFGVAGCTLDRCATKSLFRHG